MPVTNIRRALRPRSLRQQFLLAVAILALLILAGGVTAVSALRVATSGTRSLAEERLVHMQEAQDLVQQTLLIERESNRMASTGSVDAMRASYAVMVRHLEEFDQLVDRLATAGDDVAVLDLHQSSQIFRNSANVVAQLREGELQVDATKLPGAVVQAKAAQPFHDQLRHQANALVASARTQSDRFTSNYREGVRELARVSARNQNWVMLLLAGSLLTAWLVAYRFLGEHVLARLRLVSEGLRHGDIDQERPVVAVRGDDEIGEMARAVEQFLEDRRQLALVNVALRAEKLRQEELIRKLAEAHSQLLQSEKMASIGQLAAGVAHEINNPVGFVNSNLGTLQRYAVDLFDMLSAYEEREPELTAETRAALGELKQKLDVNFLREDIASLLAESKDGLQRVTRIVQDLKDFSHVDETEKQWANLEQGLDSTLNVVWNEIKYKADVVKEYGGIAAIECVPSQLNQVFMNLLVNAAQAIEERGRITLRTGQDGEHVWVEVEDTGRGIKPEHLDRIFDPFFTTKPVGTGTGLGLSLSFGIVQQHGGRIEVTSEPGKGSVFRVVLPRQLNPA